MVSEESWSADGWLNGVNDNGWSEDGELNEHGRDRRRGYSAARGRWSDQKGERFVRMRKTVAAATSDGTGPGLLIGISKDR